MNTRVIPEKIPATLLIGLVILVAVSCTWKMAKPIAEESSALGVSIKLCGKFHWFCHDPQYVVFIQLGDSDDPLAPKRLYLSRVISDGRAYLTNVEPGRYAVVAAYFRQTVAGLPKNWKKKGSGPARLKDMFTTYFPKEMVVRSVTEIIPGSIRYLGNYEVEMNRLDDLDDVQAFYFAKLERSGEIGLIDLSPQIGLLAWIITGAPVIAVKGGTGITTSAVRGILLSKWSYKGVAKKAERGEEQESAFLKAAMKELGNFGWRGRIELRFAELKR